MQAQLDKLTAVSTHSRLKAAGKSISKPSLPMKCFNTQPPEGGWQRHEAARRSRRSFNTQPPEGGWGVGQADAPKPDGFNTQPPEGGWGKLLRYQGALQVSTHSRLKAAG